MQAVIDVSLQSPHAARGFTLIELMIVVGIAAILLMIGAPALSEFVADQRVRTVGSDIVGEMAFARAKALETSRRVYVQRTGATWSGGWRIFVDFNRDQNYDAGEQVKVFNGYPAGSMYVCSTVGEFANQIVFRPDGRVERASPVNGNDGIYVVDTLGDATAANNKISGVLFGLGRATVVRMNGASPPCV